ncbi:acetyl/propionyl/methylcrotonyl-CoA carboxylase subunit alpha [Amycolatopsis sp. EV170708-02-1]|uniref:acetyl-CoA carboxylase biotin carboxylase subunit n=1 Tax=Amycolatopsis sp. EV170708-02-1 TaxID=2919322 RepID=UPI001F0CC793|nr:acetyl-CoA carboxylase biotin carboxylase subunit [Amycolatopsis sp. EV170708-02-1]UMP06789.1 acetyl-CoA carboxylase biotin carboxylase subunit [Amycolatopsis sp. EV170708-02-1]
MFSKILIANRGEIALRIARTCRELGVRTVAIYSSQDRDSAVVRFADEAVRIGPPEAKLSYLNAMAILEVARRTGAEAIHPGYGFLSEDPDFADVCAANGIPLIGPSAEVMARLGSKISARGLMADAGLPLLPGSLTPLRAEQSARLAGHIGFPVIVKAAAGGGGLGMRVIPGKDEFVDAYRRTEATARSLFGDGQVYLEKYLAVARHVEIQVLCDAHGSAVHLGSRDCSVQRRHQKLVEESPAPRLSDDLLERMGQAAIRGSLAAGYVGTGTFEFLVGPDNDYYFMEVNCRIQVEHPVTEAVTGIDLVAEQIKVAAGDRLTLRPEDTRTRGVAIECRINTEDPERGFAPTPGRLEEFIPAGGPFVRVDTHAFPGYTVPPNYDSLLAKLIVWAPDRPQAISRMRRALEEFHIAGSTVKTTKDFLVDVLRNAKFAAAEHSTALVDEMLHAESRSAERSA